MTDAESIVQQSNRLLVIATFWFEQANQAFARGDRQAHRVAGLAHSMCAAAQKNLQKEYGSA